MTAQGSQTVRLRCGGGYWTAPPMAPDRAEELRKRISNELAQIGEGWSFLTPFRTVDGRDVVIRARNVTAVEVAPWRERFTEEHGSVGLPGTKWLHDQADREKTGSAR